jgi:serine/threonine protein kinase
VPEYHSIKRLGSGAFGEVWLVEDRAFGETRAVKFVPESNIHNPTNFYHEPQTLKTLQHDNVVLVADAGTMPDGRLYIAMEYLPNGSIEDRYAGGVVPLTVALRFAIDICKGLTYTHDKGFVHRDIKPANVLIGLNDGAKISDFGLCTNTIAPGAASAAGYILHIAPEVFRDDSFTFASDIYAVGLTLYRMVNGDAFLPVVTDFNELPDLILTGKYPDRNAFQPFIPLSLRRVIRRSIDVDPTRRHETPRSLRHALEQLHISVDWSEAVVPNGSCWTGKAASATWKVNGTSTKHDHKIIVQRQAPTGRQWTVNAACSRHSKIGDYRRALTKVFETINSNVAF